MTHEEKICFCYDKAKELKDEIIVSFEDLKENELNKFVEIYKTNKRIDWVF